MPFVVKSVKAETITRYNLFIYFPRTNDDLAIDKNDTFQICHQIETTEMISSSQIKEELQPKAKSSNSNKKIV